jgi:hypothetical protein
MHTVLPWIRKTNHPALQQVIFILVMLGIALSPVLISALLVLLRN